jgi:hypothetical protein
MLLMNSQKSVFMAGRCIGMLLSLDRSPTNFVLRDGLGLLKRLRIWIGIIWPLDMDLEFALARYSRHLRPLTIEHFLDGDAKTDSNFVQKIPL